MAHYAYGPSYSDPMWLVSPDASVVAGFNVATTDPNWVGALTEAAGLDSPDVRESTEELVEADGGAHGNFWFGRRPIILSGVSYGHSTVAQRNAKYDKINRATLALRGDAELHIQPQDGGPELMTWVRRQEKIKWDGGWNKTFQIPLVSQHARLYSAALHLFTIPYGTPGGVGTDIENVGSYPSLPTLRVTGPLNAFTVSNATNGKRLVCTAAIAAGNYVDFDMVNHTASQYSTTGIFQGDRTGDINFLTTTWPTVDPGINRFYIETTTGTSGATALTVLWRDAWA